LRAFFALLCCCTFYPILCTFPLLVNEQTRGVSHGGLAIYIKKYLKAKRRIMAKLKYFSMPKYNLQKSSKNETKKNPSRYYYYNSIIITNLKFQQKPKYHLSKILILKKIDLLLFIT
jgi:hypothetical protein